MLSAGDANFALVPVMTLVSAATGTAGPGGEELLQSADYVVEGTRMRTLGVLCSLCVLAMSVPCVAVVLVNDGQPAATVMIPTDASETVRFAADELMRYVEQISGARLPVVTEGAQITGVPVHVGPVQTDRPEGVSIRVTDAEVRIGGDGDRGTLFAVYRFLEEALGCRWLAVGEEYIPKTATIALEPMELATAPVFTMRVFNARRENLRAWGTKMGFSGFYTAEDIGSTGNGYYLPDAVPMCHAYHLLIPAEKYFTTRPEWFPLLQGERRPGALYGSQLCVTAEGLADEFARNVIALFDEDPKLQVVSISPNDGFGWCECEACRALDEKLCGSRTTRQGLAGEKPFMADRVFWFANQVAERVGKVHPDRLLLVLAYINYAEPPDTIVPAPNVVPWLCHYAPADYSRPISDPTSEPNSQFNDLLVRWAAKAPHLLFYSYVSKSMWWRLPRPVWHNFAADVKHLHSLGIRRYYCQSTLSDWPEAGPLYHVLGKLLWDPSQDPEAIITDWTSHMYGSASEQMAAFYDALEHSIQESGQPFSDSPPRHVPGLYSHEDLALARGHIDAALVAAAGDEVALGRVRKVEETFRYGEHMIAALEAAHEFGIAPTVALMDTIDEHSQAALKLYPYEYSRRLFAGIAMQKQLGVVSNGFGAEEQKGGRKCWNSDETGLGDNRAGWATFYVDTPDTARRLRLEMDVWGTSEFDQIVINTGGQRKGYSEGGIWTPVKPEQPLSGSEQWDTLVFDIAPELLAPALKVQAIGLGGGDSQIWVSAVRFEQLPLDDDAE